MNLEKNYLKLFVNERLPILIEKFENKTAVGKSEYYFVRRVKLRKGDTFKKGDIVLADA